MGKCATRKLAPHHGTILVNVQHDEIVAVESPQHTAGVELQATDQMRGLVQPEHTFLLQIGAVLDDAAAAGVIVGRVVEFGGADEDVAAHKGLERGMGHEASTFRL